MTKNGYSLSAGGVKLNIFSCIYTICTCSRCQPKIRQATIWTDTCYNPWQNWGSSLTQEKEGN